MAVLLLSLRRKTTRLHTFGSSGTIESRRHHWSRVCIINGLVGEKGQGRMDHVHGHVGLSCRVDFPGYGADQSDVLGLDVY